MNKVCVLGSINMDIVLKVKDTPKVGETILSKSFEKIEEVKEQIKLLQLRDVELKFL